MLLNEKFIKMSHSITLCILDRELGIGIVVYSPLRQGFFSSSPKIIENLPDGDYINVYVNACLYNC